ncbi:unnamed protein product [Pneumocystis jirovecii]|uniref:Glutaredoxin domain-containing protein n=2 Tax=Pneumocystis jirovecii TaxID=42068 RepID=L0PA37_PNEJI|nr:glutaredoxin [Pneumocystis jirovecii RU7]KTW27223.1 glutaredoxin [Pneumocystis jirovecii RU7]CCJ28480.1 unnamed protein product [Pneumocystis jirovecii]
MTEDIMNYVESIISANKVVVFSKSYCPYCDRTKELLQNSHIDYTVLELDVIAQGSNIQQYLFEKTGQRTVPNIFINKEHIGGNSDIEALKNSGELARYFE